MLELFTSPEIEDENFIFQQNGARPPQKSIQKLLAHTDRWTENIPFRPMFIL